MITKGKAMRERMESGNATIFIIISRQRGKQAAQGINQYQ